MVVAPDRVWTKNRKVLRVCKPQRGIMNATMTAFFFFFYQNWEFSLSRKSKECTKSSPWLWLALVRVELITAVHHKCVVSLAPVGNLVLSPGLSRSQEEIWLNLLWICSKIFQSLFEWHSLFFLFLWASFLDRNQINHVLGKHFTCQVRLLNALMNVHGCRLRAKGTAALLIFSTTAQMNGMLIV